MQTPFPTGLNSRLPSLLAGLLALVLLVGSGCVSAENSGSRWVGGWATAMMPEPAAKDKLPLADATLRQVVRVSLGGSQLRLRLSNAFGATALTLHGVHVALADAMGAIRPGTDHVVLFNGGESASVPAGASLLSDPLELNVAAQTDLAVSLRLADVPAILSGHPGSRATSYLQAGDALAAPAMPEATRVVHWYFLSGVDVTPASPSAAIVALGDSITDGNGTTTDQNNRWTDALVKRLQADPATMRIAVLNQGIGGNRLLRDGLGPSMLARFDRDVLTQAGARWVIVQAGINDIGTRLNARKTGESFASAADLIGAFGQLVERAHTQGLRVIGTTITPYAGAGFYFTEDGEADRQKVNEWIRTGGRFDAVVDFDAALRDPANPSRLAAVFDKGDHLHPSLAGYVEMARVVDLKLFESSKP